jgi:hypothetical protein
LISILFNGHPSPFFGGEIMRSSAFQRFLPCLLAVAFLATASVPATAATLFSDDFGPKPLEAWTPSPLGQSSHWDGSAGTAAWDGSGHTQLVAGDPLWADYTLGASFRLDVEQNHPGGLRGRSTPRPARATPPGSTRPRA